MGLQTTLRCAGASRGGGPRGRPPGLRAGLAVVLLLVGSGCAGSRRVRSATDEDRASSQRARPALQRTVQVGRAPWRWPGRAGNPTASGETFDPRAFTAAHRALPFGTWVEVRRVDDARSVRVRINDRGPFSHKGRIIDLAEAAARRIGLTGIGVTKVEVRVVAPDRGLTREVPWTHLTPP